jgi:hypothetical protein
MARHSQPFLNQQTYLCEGRSTKRSSEWPRRQIAVPYTLHPLPALGDGQVHCLVWEQLS